MSGILMPFLGITGQAGQIAPNQIPSLSTWYNAATSATVVNGVSTNNFDTANITNGTNIGKWNDLSGVSKPVSAFGSHYPSYATPVQNGLGAVYYQSSGSDNLDINPISWITSTLAGLTIYVVARPTVFSTKVWPLALTDTSLGLWWNATNWSVGVNSGNYGTVSLTNDGTKFHTYGYIYDGTQSSNATRLVLRYDRSPVSLSFTGTIPTTVTTAPAYLFAGGDDRNSGTYKQTYMDGYIGEIMFWTRALTAAEITQVETYISTKWAI